MSQFMNCDLVTAFEKVVLAYSKQPRYNSMKARVNQKCCEIFPRTLVANAQTWRKRQKATIISEYSKNVELRRKVAQLNSRAFELDSAVFELTGENSDLCDRLNDTKTEVKSLKSTLKATEERAKTLVTELVHIRDDVDIRYTENDKKLKGSKLLEKQLQKARRTISDLAIQKDHLETKMSVLIDQFRLGKKSLQNERYRLRKYVAELEMLLCPEDRVRLLLIEKEKTLKEKLELAETLIMHLIMEVESLELKCLQHSMDNGRHQLPRHRFLEQIAKMNHALTQNNNSLNAEIQQLRYTIRRLRFSLTGAQVARDYFKSVAISYGMKLLGGHTAYLHIACDTPVINNLIRHPYNGFFGERLCLQLSPIVGKVFKRIRNSRLLSSTKQYVDPNDVDEIDWNSHIHFPELDTIGGPTQESYLESLETKPTLAIFDTDFSRHLTPGGPTEENIIDEMEEPDLAIINYAGISSFTAAALQRQADETFQVIRNAFFPPEQPEDMLDEVSDYDEVFDFPQIDDSMPIDDCMPTDDSMPFDEGKTTVGMPVSEKSDNKSDGYPELDDSDDDLVNLVIQYSCPFDNDTPLNALTNIHDRLRDVGVADALLSNSAAVLPVEVPGWNPIDNNSPNLSLTTETLDAGNKLVRRSPCWENSPTDKHTPGKGRYILGRSNKTCTKASVSHSTPVIARNLDQTKYARVKNSRSAVDTGMIGYNGTSQAYGLSPANPAMVFAQAYTGTRSDPTPFGNALKIPQTRSTLEQTRLMLLNSIYQHPPPSLMAQQLLHLPPTTLQERAIPQVNPATPSYTTPCPLSALSTGDSATMPLYPTVANSSTVPSEPPAAFLSGTYNHVSVGACFTKSQQSQPEDYPTHRNMSNRGSRAQGDGNYKRGDRNHNVDRRTKHAERR